ncbi:hypothetical protein, partial [Burkholderia vietnamiensis]|uniref:hypothetical protein n=1 Tax=Burkholderia vietnamiensis TaxID=60552 RepID=UPI001B9B0286
LADTRLSLGRRLCKMPEGDPHRYITQAAQNAPNSHRFTCSRSLHDIRTAAKHSNRRRSNCPAWKLRNFFVYLLGIPGRRSYDGGLSFSAKMQIAAEDGV